MCKLYLIRIFFVFLFFSIVFQTVKGQACNTIYMSTNLVATGAAPYKVIKTMNTTNGTAIATIANGTVVPCFDAVTGAALPAGSVLVDAEALSFDKNSNRLYFINGTTNNPAQDLCYIDLNNNNAYRYTGYPLETNTDNGYNIDRMTFGADGYGYAITDNSQDLIRFSIDPATNLPVITSLGPLINDPNNTIQDFILVNGGDMFADASGKLYLLVNARIGGRMLYSINPATRVATCIGVIRGFLPVGNNGVAVDATGALFVGGAYQSVYKGDLSTMTGAAISSGTTNVWKTGDYASCALPVFAPPVLKASKTYINTTSASTVRSGDVIEYTITLSNTGGLTATNVTLYDAIPAGAHYVPNSTTVNNAPLADINGAMAFSVSGGQLIASPAEFANGIVVPGSSNNVVLKFRVTTDANTNICNQASITYTNVDGNTFHILTDGPNNNQDPTCFYSDKGWQVTKTYTNTTGRFFVLSGDPVQYSITVTNLGGGNLNSVSLYDAIPAHAHYVANSTTINGAAVSDTIGLMPYSVGGGRFINSAGQSPGVVASGDANKAVITFTVKTDNLVQVCNQASISVTDAAGNIINVSSDDPSVSGTQDATCFFSDGILCSTCSTAVNNAAAARIITAQAQPNPFREEISMQVHSNTTEQVSIRLIDFYGRTVYTTTQQIGAGYNSLHINVPTSLATGIYVLELSSANKRLWQQKLIKQ